MFKLVDSIVWSASDLTLAATCEYALLRTVDRKLDRSPAISVVQDPLLHQLAVLGDLHEKRELERLQDIYGVNVPGSGAGVATIERARATHADLTALATKTRETFESGADVVFQAGFFDGEFQGYADFARRTSAGWVISDTKLARRAKPTALLQIAAYADQIARWDLPVAPSAELILGGGNSVSFALSDIAPVFRERRARLRDLIRVHTAQSDPIGWNAVGITMCGRCADCTLGIVAHEDLLLVAGLRREQRKKLQASGIHTVTDLAGASQPAKGMTAGTFETVRAQARLQLRQLVAEESGHPEHFHEVFDTGPLRILPEPSAGDLFFDFEGDPMFHPETSDRWGLEYLWGVLRARQSDGSLGDFWPLWADDYAGEREALVAFLDEVAAVRAIHPDMHIYHYAPYEVAALKRLVAEYKTHESQLDDLLRHGVFVDLYATVRSSIRISQPSYSIKMLEPSYMAHGREGDVTKGDASIAEYHRYCLLREENDENAARARTSLLDYNHYDCESTLELRDWLLAQVPVESSGTTDDSVQIEDQAAEPDEEALALARSLLARAGPAERLERSAEQQAWAMLESALGYYRREGLPYWWAHFDRLSNESSNWADRRDVLFVDEAQVEVVKPWGREGRQQNPRRTLRLVGTMDEGSTRPGLTEVHLLFAVPAPASAMVPDRGLFGCGRATATVTGIDELAANLYAVTVVEVLRKDDLPYDDLPVAVTPGNPPNTDVIVKAIREVALVADTTGVLPSQAVVDILAKRPPRLTSLDRLVHTGDRRADIVASVLDLDCSYLAVQGPPGTGKTYSGSHAIAELVTKHGWKIGVVGQSHAVVENMLNAIVRAGLDPRLIGKRDKRSSGDWQGVKTGPDLAKFCDERAGSGFVVGGTAWTFASSAIQRDSLDLLVIDEAGQFSLATTIGVSVAAKRLLLLGDPQQLPQVSQGTHGEPVDESALGWVMGRHATMPRELGYFLDTTYRMHPSLAERVSTLSYAGELRAESATSKRELVGVEPGLEVVRLEHSGNRVACLQEAEQVVLQVRRLLGTDWLDPEVSPAPRPLQEADFLVVTPFNGQRQLILRELAEAGLGDVRVGTVDRFQGQQAPVVIVSMTSSSQADVPRGIGFLLNRNRVNVAVSRAQWLAVVIRSRRLTDFMPVTTDGLLELGAFIGLCETNDRVHT